MLEDMLFWKKKKGTESIRKSLIMINSVLKIQQKPLKNGDVMIVALIIKVMRKKKSPLPRDWENERGFSLLTKEPDRRDNFKPASTKEDAPEKTRRVAQLSSVAEITAFKVSMEQLFAAIKENEVISGLTRKY